MLGCGWLMTGTAVGLRGAAVVVVVDLVVVIVVVVVVVVVEDVVVVSVVDVIGLLMEKDSSVGNTIGNDSLLDLSVVVVDV